MCRGWMVARSKEGVPVVDAKPVRSPGGACLIVRPRDGRRRDSTVAASIHITHGPHTSGCPVTLEHLFRSTFWHDVRHCTGCSYETRARHRRKRITLNK